MNTAFPCFRSSWRLRGSQTGASWLNFSATAPQGVRSTPRNEKWARSKDGSGSFSNWIPSSGTSRTTV